VPEAILAAPGLGVDYSFARPDPRALSRAGVRFVSRYLAFLPNSKVITAGERDALWAAGLALLLNWEQSEGDFLQPAKGPVHGAEASRQALALGYPRSLPILVSCDQEAKRSDFAKAVQYFEGFAAAARGYPLGVYAQSELANLLVARGLVSVVWGPMATAWNHGVPYDRIDFRQFKHPSDRWPALRPFGAHIDVNVAERGLAVWVPAGAGVEPVAADGPVVHERDEWLAGYAVAPGEGSAWWGAPAFPSVREIDNITWHYPAGFSNADPAQELRRMQSDYHRRRDAGVDNGRPPPFNRGYNLGYNAVIDLAGGIWKVRWTDQRCAANELPGNKVSFAVQFMTARPDDDLTPAQVRSARWLDRELRGMFPNIRPGAAGHKGHRDWVRTACPGDLIYATHVTTGDLLAAAEPAAVQQEDLVKGEDEMRFRFFKAKGFHDLLAVGPGQPFNPGSPEAAQELVDCEQVATRTGQPVMPGTDYRSVPIEVSVALWTAMNGGSGPVAPESG
jgi:hypothetical protein